MAIRNLDVPRQQDHHQFIKKEEEFLEEIKELKENLMKVTEEKKQKKKYLFDGTHKVMKLGMLNFNKWSKS